MIFDYMTFKLTTLVIDNCLLGIGIFGTLKNSDDSLVSIQMLFRPEQAFIIPEN